MSVWTIILCESHNNHLREAGKRYFIDKETNSEMSCNLLKVTQNSQNSFFASASWEIERRVANGKAELKGKA